MNSTGNGFIAHFRISKFVRFWSHEFWFTCKPYSIGMRNLKIRYTTLGNKVSVNSWLFLITFKHYLVSKVVYDRNELFCTHCTMTQNVFYQFTGGHSSQVSGIFTIGNGYFFHKVTCVHVSIFTCAIYGFLIADYAITECHPIDTLMLDFFLVIFAGYLEVGLNLGFTVSNLFQCNFTYMVNGIAIVDKIVHALDIKFFTNGCDSGHSSSFRLDCCFSFSLHLSFHFGNFLEFFLIHCFPLFLFFFLNNWNFDFFI